MDFIFQIFRILNNLDLYTKRKNETQFNNLLFKYL